MKYTIGLDIGIASVGWAVINEEKSRIGDLGVRTFKKAEEADGKSLNSVRREARGTRKRIRRRAVRMQKVKELFLEYNLVSKEELKSLYVITENSIDVYELRADGLDELLDRKEWARVLTNIAKRRGYKSNRKTEAEDSEGGKLITGTDNNKRLLEEKGYRTVGEMLFKDEKFANNKRNKGGQYENTILRSMLIDEVRILFAKQREFGSIFASKEFEEKYLDVITYQKPFMTEELLNKMLGKCTLEKGEPRAPKNSYTFERFMLLQKINNISVITSNEDFKITDEQRKVITEMAYNQAEIKYSQLRKVLGLSDGDRFRQLNYYDKNKDLSEHELVKKVENTKFVKLEGWHKIRIACKQNGKFSLIVQNPELQNIIADALVRNKEDEGIKKYLSDRNIDEDIINAVLSVNFTKFGHLSYKAMNKIIPELEKGYGYTEACSNVGFKDVKKCLSKKLPPISKLDNVVLNPVVLRAVSQTRKVVNAIIDRYGSPDEVHIETAKELAKSADERDKIDKRQKENEANNEKIKEYIRENFQMEPKPFDIVKVKLWREQGNKCAYSGLPIDANRLFEDKYVEVDHIIPFSRSFDDSYNNKVLVLAKENQNKREKTPFEYMGEDQEKWHRFEEFVLLIYKYNPKKRENLLIKNFSEEKSKKWIDRNINDTRYIAKFMNDYITNNLRFMDSNKKQKVFNINGQTTAALRHFWGLSKDRSVSDKHHAQDAVVIACATTANIKKVAEYSKYKSLYSKEDKYNKNIVLKEPWPKFRQEVQARMEDYDNNGELYSLKYGEFRNYDDIDISTIKPIFVSRMPERKITGKAHKETMRSSKYIDKGFTLVKKDLKSITKSEIEAVINNETYRELYLSDKNLYDDIYQKLKNTNFKADKAFKEEYRKHSKTGNGPIVRSIKVPSAGNTGVKLKNKAIAENANMVRVDVFSRNNKYYLVPIYVSDFVKKELPNKAIVQNKKEEDWIEMTKEYEFKFSLYPNDLVKIKKNNGKEIYAYYNTTDRSTAAVKVLSVEGGKKPDRVYVQNLEIFEKYQVGILGNINKIKKEKREGVKKN